MPWTTEEKTFIVEAYFRLKSIHAAQLQFKERFGCREFPVHSMIYRWVNKFRTHGTVHNLNGPFWFVIEPFWFEDDNEQSVTINTERYVQVLGKFWTALGRRREVVRALQWFQQDGATPSPPPHTHTSNESLAWLRQRFPDRLISRRCDPEWSPHSPDLNPPDFYLWGYLKDRVFGNNPQTIPDLKAAITAAIKAILREGCGRVIENFARQIHVCLQRRRDHLEHIFERQWNKEFL